MNKQSGFRSRIKAKMKNILKSDEEPTRPSTPLPTDNSGDNATPSAGQAKIHLSPNPTEPSHLNNPTSAVTGQAETAVQAVEQPGSHIPLGHPEAPVAASGSTPHPGESLKPAAPSSSTKTDSPKEGASPWIRSEAWTSLKAFLDTINQAASTSGLGPVKNIVEGLAKCIGIYEDAAQGREEYNELRTQLEATFDELNQYFSASLVITASIASICGSIQKELKHVKAQEARPIQRRMAEAETDADEVLDCYRRIQDHLQRLSRNANISTWVIVDQLATDNRLQNLAPSLWACYNSEKATELGRRSCTEGTRTNVLLHMREWAASRNSGNIYWMNGMAGTGKTTIAYSLCQQLDTEKDSFLLCASFFCSRSLPECRSVGRIIPSIAYQIAQCSRPFRYALSKATEANPDAHTRSPDLQLDSLIVQPFLNPQVRQAFPMGMVAVIDALDECEDTKSTKQILEVLLTKSKDLPIKFVVSSRPEAAIRYQMEKNGTWVGSRVVLHELDTGEVQTDIKTYLKAELTPVKPSEWEIDKLAERADVLFIYAATVIRYVGYDDFGRNPRARLNAMLGISEQQSKAQTKDIDQLYRTILEAAFNSNELEDREQDDIKLILKTVVCAKAPLTVDALNALLRLGDVERVHAALLPLWSVLHMMGPKMTVTTLHASFPDYLTNSARSGDSPWHCDVAAHHHVLVQRCFETIRDARPRFNICRLESSYLNDNEVEDLDARVERFIPTVLRYVCRYWSVHLGASHTGKAFVLMALLEQFLTSHLLLWLEVMNLTKSIHTSPGDLISAKQWATQHGATTEAIRLIHDAWRFALTIVSSPISQSTPHIYISMLPFLPSHSPIRKCYAHRTRGMIAVYGTALDRRKALLARWRLEDQDLVRCRSDEDRIRWLEGYLCAACSPDGTLFAISPRLTPGISLIDTSSGRPVRKFSFNETDKVSCIAFSPEGTRVAGCLNGDIWVWDVGNGQPVIGPLEGHQGDMCSMVFSPCGSRIVSGSTDGIICVWDVFPVEPALTSLVGHTKIVNSIAVSSDGTRIVSGSDDRTIRIWNVQSGRLALDPITGHSDNVVSVILSPNDKLVVSGSWDFTVRVWDSHTGQPLLGPFHLTSLASSLAISPNGTHLSVGLSSGAIYTWDAITGEGISGPVEAHTSQVTMLAYSPDGTHITSYCDICEELCLIDAQSATEPSDPLPGHSKSIISIDISPDGKYLVSGSEDTTVCVWDPMNGQPVFDPLTEHTNSVHLVRYSVDGNRILSCSRDRTLCQWDARTGGPIPADNPIVNTLAMGFYEAVYSPDGSHIATISNHGAMSEYSHIHIWNSRTGIMVQGPIKHEAKGLTVAFSADGTTLITGLKDGAVCTCNIQTGQLIYTIGPYKRPSPFAFVFSPDESHTQLSAFLSVFSPDGLHQAITGDPRLNTVTYRNITQIQEQTTAFFEGHTQPITSIRFSSDCARIVSGADDRTVHIWDVKTGTSLFGPLVGHSTEVKSVAYSPDGTYVASASRDATIRIWDISTQSDTSLLTRWELNEDGWVVDTLSRRLIWVPPDFRERLLFPKNIMLISQNGYVKLNFEDALLGKAWPDCWMDG